MHAITANKKGNEFEREQEGVYGMFQSEERERRNGILISIKQMY